MGNIRYNHKNPVNTFMKWLLFAGVVAFCIWLTVGFCLYGGITGIIAAYHAGWPAGATAWSIIRVLFTWLSVWFGIFLSVFTFAWVTD